METTAVSKNDYAQAWTNDVVSRIMNATLDTETEILLRALGICMRAVVQDEHPELDDAAARSYCARVLMYGSNK
jgi:hypothetical protein